VVLAGDVAGERRPLRLVAHRHDRQAGLEEPAADRDEIDGEHLRSDSRERSLHLPAVYATALADVVQSVTHGRRIEGAPGDVEERTTIERPLDPEGLEEAVVRESNEIVARDQQAGLVELGDHITRCPGQHRCEQG
jgi:hypothetical protein